MSALTAKEIQYLLVDVYNVSMYAYKLRKLDYVACIIVEMEKDIRKYERLLPQTSQDAENSNTAKIPV